MKQAFIGLSLLMLLMNIGQVRKLLRENEQPFSWQSGSLADIAKEVIAIPLQDSGRRQITEAESVRLEGDNLFLISEETLYRFTRKGEYVCAITRPEEMRVAGYVIDPVQRQLIVFGNVNDIFYYTFDGKLLRCKKLTSDFGNRRQVYAAAYHKGHVLTVEAVAAERELQPYRRELVEYDTTFQRIDARAIQPMSLMRTDESIGYLPPVVAIDPSSEQPYAYVPSLQPQHLLRDTLFIWQQRQRFSALRQREVDVCPLLPIWMGKRFWIASYQSSFDGELGYTFCYDTLKGHYWQTEEGFEDDFYHTGKVSTLKPVDLYGDFYCFSCLAQQMEQPLSEENDIVLFLVTMKA
ncbi:MAG: 6-bladed beta-propeller [Parabacteroides sp.]